MNKRLRYTARRRYGRKQTRRRTAYILIILAVPASRRLVIQWHSMDLIQWYADCGAHEVPDRQAGVTGRSRINSQRKAARRISVQRNSFFRLTPSLFRSPSLSRF